MLDGPAGWRPNADGAEPAEGLAEGLAVGAGLTEGLAVGAGLVEGADGTDEGATVPAAERVPGVAMPGRTGPGPNATTAPSATIALMTPASSARGTARRVAIFARGYQYQTPGASRAGTG